MRNVLIVDDDPIICQGLANLIDWSGYGYAVTTCATSGEMALTLARERAPSLVVTDIRMNGMHGLELLEKLSAESLCSRAIVVSSYAEFDYAQEAMLHGVRHYLLKPVSRLKLEQAVAALSREAAAEELPPEPAAEAPVRNLSSRKRKLASEMTDYIRRCYHTEISVNDLAEALHMTPSYAGQLFHDVMGKTFSEYLNEYRIDRARDIILQSSSTIYEVSRAVGYSNMAYFYRMFKKLTGVTPSEFRNQRITPEK